MTDDDRTPLRFESEAFTLELFRSADDAEAAQNLSQQLRDWGSDPPTGRRSLAADHRHYRRYRRRSPT